MIAHQDSSAVSVGVACGSGCGVSALPVPVRAGSWVAVLRCVQRAVGVPLTPSHGSRSEVCGMCQGAGRERRISLFNARLTKTQAMCLGTNGDTLRGPASCAKTRARTRRQRRPGEQRRWAGATAAHSLKGGRQPSSTSGHMEWRAGQRIRVEGRRGEAEGAAWDGVAFWSSKVAPRARVESTCRSRPGAPLRSALSRMRHPPASDRPRL